MADQLAIWNVALAHLGERRLASLTEPREPARVLADEWDAAVRGCLEMAVWSFATRTKMVNANGQGAGPFANALPKPADWLRTADIAADAGLTTPLDGYLEEGGAWYAAPATIWVRYVSTDPAYGYSVAGWTQQFADLVALTLAARAARRLTGSGEYLGEVVKLRDSAIRDALAFEEQTAARQYPAPSGAGETRLAIYNAALAHLGRARTPSLTSASDAVRALHDQWRAAVRHCLQAAPWGFACIYSAVFSTGALRLGLKVYAKPADWLRTADLSVDGNFIDPVPTYVEDGDSWAAQAQPLYVRYVSSDPAYGFDLTRWTPRFCDLVALRLAEMSAGRLAPDAKDVAAEIGKARQAAEVEAEAVEAESVGRILPPGMGSPTRLQISNDALAHLGRPRLPSLTEVSSVARAVNDQWRGALLWALQQAPWQFAVAEVTLAPTGATPPNALTGAFVKPADWVMTLDAAKDSRFTVPVYDLVEERGAWYANTAALSVRFVSSASDLGQAVNLWPPLFADLVALRLAEMCAGRLGPAPESLPAKLETARGAAIAAEMARQQRSFPEDAAGATVLRVFNAALGHLGRPRLAALTEVHPTMRLLTDAWATEVRWALEQGPWTFAIRAIMIGPFAASGPTFGYKNGFRKPDDWLQTVLVSEFEDMHAGATAYADETGWWFSDAPGLFIRYVSTGVNYGLNLPRWPAAFADLVALRIAEQIAPRLDTAAGRIAELVAHRQDAMKRLRATDALNTPPAFPPTGSWVSARRGGRVGSGRRFGDGPGGPGIPFTGDTTLSGDSDLPADSDFVPRISG